MSGNITVIYYIAVYISSSSKAGATPDLRDQSAISCGCCLADMNVCSHTGASFIQSAVHLWKNNLAGCSVSYKTIPWLKRLSLTFKAVTSVPDAERGFDWISFWHMKIEICVLKLFCVSLSAKWDGICHASFLKMARFASNQMLPLNRNGKNPLNISMSHSCNCGCAASYTAFS